MVNFTLRSTDWLQCRADKLLNKLPAEFYTRDQKIEAATHYAIHGSLAKLERDLGIPKSTSCTWGKRGDEVWHSTIERVRTENDDRVLAKAAEIIDAAQAQTMAELPNATAAQASIIGATWVDKAQLLQSRPTSIRGDSGGVAALAKQFADLADQWQEKQARVVQTVQPEEQDDEQS